MVLKSQKQLSVPFFVDRNLGKTVAQAIRDAGYEVALHDDHFDQSTPDVVWLPVVGKRRWPVITHDSRITKNVAELNALVSAGVYAFFINILHPTGTKMAAAVVKSLPEIVQIIERREPPIIATIDKRGKVTDLKGYDQIIASIDEMNERQHKPKTHGSFID